jgi:hypothetical protein
MKDPSHIVLRRPFSDDQDREEEPKWEKVGFASSLAAAKRLAMRPVTDDGEAVDVGPGDLLLAMPLDQINPLLFAKAAKHLFVVRGEGGVVAAPPTVGLMKRKTWLEGWDADGWGTAMIAVSVPLGKANVVLLMCEALRVATGLMPTNGWMQQESVRVINAAEKVARGSGGLHELKYAAASSQRAGFVGGLIKAAAVAKTTERAAYMASYALSLAAGCVVEAGDEGGVSSEMGNVIRRRVPLGTILRLRLVDGPQPDLSEIIPKGYV